MYCLLCTNGGALGVTMGILNSLGMWLFRKQLGLKRTEGSIYDEIARRKAAIAARQEKYKK